MGVDQGVVQYCTTPWCKSRRIPALILTTSPFGQVLVLGIRTVLPAVRTSTRSGISFYRNAALHTYSTYDSVWVWNTDLVLVCTAGNTVHVLAQLKEGTEVYAYEYEM